MTWFTPERRKWIYGIAIPLGPLLMAYGVVDSQTWALWLGVLQQIFVPSLAFANVNRAPSGPVDVIIPDDLEHVEVLDVES